MTYHRERHWGKVRVSFGSKVMLKTGPLSAPTRLMVSGIPSLQGPLMSVSTFHTAPPPHPASPHTSYHLCQSYSKGRQARGLVWGAERAVSTRAVPHKKSYSEVAGERDGWTSCHSGDSQGAVLLLIPSARRTLQYLVKGCPSSVPRETGMHLALTSELCGWGKFPVVAPLINHSSTLQT